MLRQLFLILITIVSLAACSGKDKLPAKVIQPDKFAEVLIDVHLAEADLIEKKLGADSSRLFIAEKYEVIFAMHDISEEEFKKSFDYYNQHPQQLFDIYEKVVQGLTEAQEQQIYSE